MNLKIFSIGGYSSWCFYRPARILFDCGEGCAFNLRNEVFAVEKIFIGHWHGDHVNGLAGFLAARNSARGDKEKALEIYFDIDNLYAKRYMQFLSDINQHLSYEVKPRPFSGNVKIDDRRYVETFPILHSKSFKSFGFRVMETRTRLKAGLDPSNIKAIIASGVKPSEINETYNGNLFTYTLDSYQFDPKYIEGAAEWVADCTFLNDKDRDDPTHMTREEIVSLAETQNVKTTYLAHISSRYKKEEISILDTRKLGMSIRDFRAIYHYKYNEF